MVSLISYLGCWQVVLVGELVVQVVLLREMRQECSCSLLSDRITHQLHVSLVFMQHVNYKCDPYKLFPEQPINRWQGWLNIAIGLTHQTLVLHVQSWFDTSSEINGAFCCLDLVRQRSLNHTWCFPKFQRIILYLHFMVECCMTSLKHSIDHRNILHGDF